MAHTFNTTKQHYLRDTIFTLLLRVLELHLIYKYIKHITATKKCVYSNGVLMRFMRPIKYCQMKIKSGSGPVKTQKNTNE